MISTLAELDIPVQASRAQSHPRSTDQRPRSVICHVLHALHVGGAELLARDFALQNATQFTPVFALLDELGALGEELRRAGHAVEVLGRKPGFDSGCVRRLARFLREQRVSLIHAHQYAPLFYSAMARLPAARIPILFTEHGRDFPDFRRWKRVLANRLLLRRSDRFVAVGETVRQALIDYEGLPAPRVQVIYNGSDLSAFDPQRRQRAAVRKDIGIRPDALLIMQVARLNRLKDYPTAIRAMNQIRTVVPAAQLALVGDGEERLVLEQIIDRLSLKDHVHLLGTRHDVPRLLQAADVFLLTSISEGIPLTLIEAMATGLPCVATRVGGVSEVVLEGKTGLLAEAGDAPALAAHLARLADDPALRAQLGVAGHQRAAEHFSARQMQAAYHRLYCQLGSRHARWRTGAERSS